MQTELLIDLIDKVQKLKTETQTIEIKSALKGCLTKLFDTISAFSNQDAGGTIVFGIDEQHGFNVCGVYDARTFRNM